MNGSWFHSAKRSSPSCNVLKTVILSDEEEKWNEMNSCNMELDDSVEDVRNGNGNSSSYASLYRLRLE